MLKLILFIYLIGLANYTKAENCNPLTLSGTLCSCTANVISCENRGLHAVPTFPQPVSADILNLMRNDIHNLTTDIFKNVRVKIINLSGNKINKIQSGAFNNVKDNLIELILKDNALTKLPEEISNLGKIQSLDVRGNPIEDPNFTDSVMYQIGDSITDFKFGSAELDKWPQSLSHFQELNSLMLDTTSSNMQVIPAEAFHSFETTLTQMTIQNTELLVVPIGVSTLRNLKTFHFDHNHKVGDKGVLLQSFVNQHSSLQTLSLIDDRLTKFPRVLRYLSSLKNLTMDQNTLAFVNDEAIGLLGNVKILSLKNCSLDRVPGALSNLVGLTNLDLSDNKIGSIERNDMEQLTLLEKIYFNNNPLTYVSNETFRDLHSLETLDLSNTKITLVPEAIRNVYRYRNHCLINLIILENKLDCMCELEWLKELKTACPAMNIKGNCDTIHVTLEQYIHDFVPRCPAWMLKQHQAIYPYYLPGRKRRSMRTFYKK